VSYAFEVDRIWFKTMRGIACVTVVGDTSGIGTQYLFPGAFISVKPAFAAL